MMRGWIESACVFAGITVLASCLASCGQISGGGQTVAFVIHIDSITGPTAVSGGAAFEQQLWGHVGPNGCYSFTGFKLNRVPTRLDVTANGARRITLDLCTQAVVDLRGEPIRIEPLIPVGLFTIAVHQPDGSLLTRVIHSE
jgi:hypothetical protein